MFSRIQRSIEPVEVDLLQRVFDQLCVDAECEKASVEAEDIGSALIHLYEAGTKDEAELLATMRARRTDFIKRSG
jgi:hypothetical protein